MKIVRTDLELQTPRVDETLRREGHDLVLLPDGVPEDILMAEMADADLLLMCYTPVSRQVIEASPRLKGIVKYGVGIDAIDIPAAKENGVIVVNIPEYAEETVAEGAFAMMISLAKKLPALDRQMNANGWAWPEPAWLATDIAEQTVGIVGFGKIGRSVARMAGLGFRANVIAYDPFVSSDAMAAEGVLKVDQLDQLMPAADFVMVHTVLNTDTHHLIGEQQLRQMKPTAFLINAARGAIVDEQALLKALNENWIAGAGLDAFSQEPLNLERHPLSSLFNRRNVILMPHLTFYTEQAMDRLETETLDRCFELMDGRGVVVKSTDPRLAGQKGAIY